MDAFEPPKYIASLIAAINDGAKAAQTGALAFSAIGLYLIATAFSTTDEDLLLQHTTSIAQFGVQVSVVFSLAIAPLIFVALHIFTLIRYDLLATNLRQFRADLGAMVLSNADRERCRQLLANVEFVIARVAPRDSPLQSRLFAWVSFGIIGVLPVAVLIAVQVSALRYQSDVINWAQRGAVVVDLFLLVWFYRRERLAKATGRASTTATRRVWIGVLWAPVAIIMADVAWLKVPHPDTDGAELVRAGDIVLAWRFLPALWQVVSRPLDVLVCPLSHGWGCRFLRIDHRMLVGHVWKSEAIADLRRGDVLPDETYRGDRQTALAAVEGVFLRNRLLRFAFLSESHLYGADLIGADLTGADLNDADLTGAKLAGAHLKDANLSRVHLTGADLEAADLERAELLSADLGDATLPWAKLKEAHLLDAHLNGAHLHDAIMDGANLNGAHVNSADMTSARLNAAYLSNAILTKADLTGASLKDAHLNGADLTDAKLNGANLTSADLISAKLDGANLSLAILTKADLTSADLTGADLTGADFTGADLTGAIVTQKQLNQACTSGSKLPLGLTNRCLAGESVEAPTTMIGPQ
jgi:uncharacterized protein YjbI with pentapeptide repeats